MTYRSAFQRLAQVPEVFTGSDLTMLFGWSSATASTYLANWRKAGWVKSLGGRADVHMNLAMNRHINPELALRRVFPLATLVGADMLRAAGWTTQILSQPDVAVPQTGPRYAVDGFNLVGRPDAWFDRVRPGTLSPAQGLRRLLPAWAWADMLARAQDRRVRNAWLLPPDDLDFDLIAEDAGVPAALAVFGLDAGLATEAGYADFYDMVSLLSGVSAPPSPA